MIISFIRGANQSKENWALVTIAQGGNITESLL